MINELDEAKPQDELIELIQDFEDWLSIEFKFKLRPEQTKACHLIIQAWAQGAPHFFLHGPTGSGKSIIALAIGSWLTTKGQTGYLLTSNKFLQKQYTETIDQLGLNCPSLFGIDNYTCNQNGQKA